MATRMATIRRAACFGTCEDGVVGEIGSDIFTRALSTARDAGQIIADQFSKRRAAIALITR